MMYFVDYTILTTVDVRLTYKYAFLGPTLNNSPCFIKPVQTLHDADLAEPDLTILTWPNLT